jgi:hypothetical protein
MATSVSVYGIIIARFFAFVNTFLKKFFFFWKKGIDKPKIICYNVVTTEFQLWKSGGL